MPGSAAAQAPATPALPKLPVYGEVGLGFGQTLFRGATKAKLSQALGGSFRSGSGYNLMAGFYAAPAAWQGLGVGARIRGTFGTPGPAANNGDEYIFNYYNLAATAKYYPGGEFNRGFYGRGSLGFGQFTSKRLNDAARSYAHQYAIGSSVMLGAGYTLRRSSGLGLSLEAEYEHASRNGTVDQVGDVRFGSGQLGLNVIVSF